MKNDKCLIVELDFTLYFDGNQAIQGLHHNPIVRYYNNVP